MSIREFLRKLLRKARPDVQSELARLASRCAYTVQKGDSLLELCEGVGGEKEALLREVRRLNGNRSQPLPPLSKFWIPGREVVLPRTLCLEILKRQAKRN